MVTVKGEIVGVTAFPECGSESTGDQICTFIAGYPITDDLTGEKVKDNAKVYPVIVDLKVCNVAHPNLIRAVCGELAF